MAEGSVTVEIPLPFNLTWGEVKLEASPNIPRSLEENLAWFDDNELFTTPDQVELIFRSVTILKHKFPEATMDQCLETAIIWLCG